MVPGSCSCSASGAARRASGLGAVLRGVSGRTTQARSAFGLERSAGSVRVAPGHRCSVGVGDVVGAGRVVAVGLGGVPGASRAAGRAGSATGRGAVGCGAGGAAGAAWEMEASEERVGRRGGWSAGWQRLREQEARAAAG